MTLNLEELKSILENDYELLLFYDTHEEEKLVDVTPEPDPIPDPEPDTPSGGDNTDPVTPNPGETEEPSNPGSDVGEVTDPSENEESKDNNTEKVSVLSVDVSDTEDTSTERIYEIQKISRTRVYKIPFTIPTDHNDELAIRIDPKDIPKIIIESIKLCKDKIEIVTISKNTVDHINEVIRCNKYMKPIYIIIASTK